MSWLSDLVARMRSRVRTRLGRPPLETPPRGQPTSIDDVVAQLTAIGQGLPPADGVAEFNRMYLQVTELVRDQVGGGYFVTPAFVTRLDLVFAGIYLDAVAATAPGTAWAPLFECRSGPGRLSIQYALAGMNAHINHDLPIAVGRTCRQLGLTPDSPGVAVDYARINGLLATVEQQVRESFLAGTALDVDKGYAAPVVNLVCNLEHHRGPRRGLDQRQGPLGTPRRRTAPGRLPRHAVGRRRARRPLPAGAGRRPPLNSRFSACFALTWMLAPAARGCARGLCTGGTPTQRGR